MSPASNIELRFDRGTLLLRGANPRQFHGMDERAIWVWDERVGAFRTEAMWYLSARKCLRAEFAERFLDQTRPTERIAWPKVNLPKLRTEQESAVAAWRDAGGRGVIVMPTGTGKTQVALAAMERAKVSTLVVAPVRDLMHQWHARILAGLGYDAGMVGDSLFNIRPITVTTYDSAYLHMADMGDRFGLIVFDEAHHLAAETYRRAAMFSMAPWRMGLTATPERSDGKEKDLDYLIGPVAFRQEISAAKGKTLAEYNVVRVPVKLSDEEQRRYDDAGSVVRTFMQKRREELEAGADGKSGNERGKAAYTWEDLCAESGKDPEARRAQKAFYIRKSIEDRAEEKLRVLEDIFRLHVGERVIVFAGSNAMAMDVSRRFLVPTILSHSRKNERRAVLGGFEKGDFPVLVANMVLDEGVDVPAAKVGVVIGGGASTRQAKQRLGRILRKTGEANATLYEVVCEETGDVERSRKRRRSDAYGSVKRGIPANPRD